MKKVCAGQNFLSEKVSFFSFFSTKVFAPPLSCPACSNETCPPSNDQLLVAHAFPLITISTKFISDELLRMIGKLSHSSAKRSQIIRHNEEFRPIIGTTAVHRNYLDTKASKRSWMYKNEEFERHLHGRGYFSRKERELDSKRMIS